MCDLMFIDNIAQSNAAWNPACALTRLSANNLLNLSPRSEALIRGVMLEVLSVAHAKGFDVITEKDIEWHLERPRANTAANTKEPSTLTVLYRLCPNGS